MRKAVLVAGDNAFVRTALCEFLSVKWTSWFVG